MTRKNAEQELSIRNTNAAYNRTVSKEQHPDAWFKDLQRRGLASVDPNTGEPIVHAADEATEEKEQ
jgi:hypothetical protein